MKILLVLFVVFVIGCESQWLYLYHREYPITTKAEDEEQIETVYTYLHKSGRMLDVPDRGIGLDRINKFLGVYNEKP